MPFAGFRFPAPSLDPLEYYFAEEGSELHIFVNLQAMDPAGTGTDAYEVGDQEGVESSRGELFSYSYAIPCDGVSAPATFVYTNLTRGETFLMRRLVSVTCTNSRSAMAPEEYDTVTFSGFGTWSMDAELHFANVQISTAPDSPYVGIQIDGGFASNVNTKPAEKPVP